MKIVVNDPKTGLSYQKELEKGKEALLVGKKIREGFDGGILGLEGYALEITGGSSKDGLPMRPDVRGARKVNALVSGGAGVRGLKKGERVKKAVYGNTLSLDVVQVNAKITQVGGKKLEELGFVQKPKEKKEAAKAGA